MKSTEGIVANIQHFTVHDGPGIRTEVFLKGCPLRCPWCSNPETQRAKPQIGVYRSRCIGVDKCGQCRAVCPLSDQGVLEVVDGFTSGIDRRICDTCQKCAEVCPTDALTVWGERMSVDEVMVEVRADREFYERSGGGVTVSGGEALVQWEFAQALLRQCQDEGIHTCLESALCCRPDVLDEVCPVTDLVITDLKHMDRARHRSLTGVDPKRIHDNIVRIVDRGVPVVVRIPVIPGHNDDLDNLRATVAFITRQLRNRALQVQLLPYRPLGLEKYTALGLDYPMPPDAQWERPRWEEALGARVNMMTACGVPAVAGANAKLP